MGKDDILNEGTSIGSVVVHGSAITLFAVAVKGAVHFGQLIILAHLLTPRDFGLAACITPLIAFFVLVQDFGLSQLVVQRTSIKEEETNAIFWVSVSIGGLGAGLLALGSPLVVWFFDADELRGMIYLAAIAIFLQAVAVLPRGLLNRDLRFKVLALIDVGAVIVGAAATVTGAWLGLQYLALVCGTVATAVVSCGGAIALSNWIPLRPTFRLDGEAMKFGLNLGSFNLVSFLIRNSDNIIVGRILGPEALGYYDRAYQLMCMPLHLLVWPFGRVLIPVLSRVRHNEVRFRSIYVCSVAIMSVAAVPGIAVAVALPRETVALIFGPRWDSIVPVFGWLAIASLIQPVSITGGWIFISMGRTREMLRWGVYGGAVSIGSFLFGVGWGVEGVGAGYAIAVYVLIIPPLFVIIGRISPVRAIDLIAISCPLLFGALLTWMIANWGFKDSLGLEGAVLIMITVVCSYLVTVGMCFCSWRASPVCIKGLEVARLFVSDLFRKGGMVGASNS